MASMKHTKGATITSILVATALAGIVAAVVAQLITNQSKVLRTLTLREERENLLKHYRNTLVSGWDNTLANGCGALYNRDGNVAVPSGGLKVKSDDLYSSTSASDGYWEVMFDCGSKSGSMFAGDKYETTHGSGLHSETHREVTLTVKFLADEHPHISTKLATRKEMFYMHQRKRLAVDTDCANADNRSRRNSFKPDIDRVPASLFGGTRPTSFPLYKGEGAVIQYDFNTNYVKCSQVPFVKRGSCAHDAAIVGFWGTMEGGTGYPYVYGDYVCSHDNSTGNQVPDSVTGLYHHPKIQKRLPSTKQKERLITAYRGRGDGNPDNMQNFGNPGCQHDSNSNNHTYVSYIDSKGTARCQTTRHVVQNNVSCNTYPHPGVPSTAYNSSYNEPDAIVDRWGDDSEESNYESLVRSVVNSGAIPAGFFSRIERDTSWTLGRGGFLEFAGFNHTSGKQPGYLVSQNETPDCSMPGYEKGDTGPQGDQGSNGSSPGPPGADGTISFSPDGGGEGECSDSCAGFGGSCSITATECVGGQLCTYHYPIGTETCEKLSDDCYAPRCDPRGSPTITCTSSC